MSNVIQFPKHLSRYYEKEVNAYKLELLDLHASHSISDKCFRARMRAIGHYRTVTNARIIKPKQFMH